MVLVPSLSTRRVGVVAAVLVFFAGLLVAVATVVVPAGAGTEEGGAAVRRVCAGRAVVPAVARLRLLTCRDARWFCSLRRLFEGVDLLTSSPTATPTYAPSGRAVDDATYSPTGPRLTDSPTTSGPTIGAPTDLTYAPSGGGDHPTASPTYVPPGRIVGDSTFSPTGTRLTDPPTTFASTTSTSTDLTYAPSGDGVPTYGPSGLRHRTNHGIFGGADLPTASPTYFPSGRTIDNLTNSPTTSAPTIGTSIDSTYAPSGGGVLTYVPSSHRHRASLGTSAGVNLPTASPTYVPSGRATQSVTYAPMGAGPTESPTAPSPTAGTPTSLQMFLSPTYGPSGIGTVGGRLADSLAAVAPPPAASTEVAVSSVSSESSASSVDSEVSSMDSESPDVSSVLVSSAEPELHTYIPTGSPPPRP